MRLYQSVREALKETERELWEFGHKTYSETYQDKKGGYQSKELVGYSLMLFGGDDLAEVVGRATPLGLYINREFDERIQRFGPLNPGSSWQYRKDVWEKFLEEGGQFSYTYAERINWQLHAAEKLITEDPGTRQAVITIYDKGLDHINRGGKRRIPCTMHYQILKREPDLYLIHSMRSCDFYTHFLVDMGISWKICNWMAGVLNVMQPRLIMQFGSLHAFKEDMEKKGIF